nr:response regulator [Spirulina subsalsa]
MMKRILVIDDEDDIREVVQLSLEVSGGWEVFTAASGKEGIEIAKQQRPDVILLDVMMPDLDGMETLHRLRSQGETVEIPVILLTAKVASYIQNDPNYYQLGVWAILPKLFDPLTFGAKILEILSQPSTTHSG